MSKFKVGDRVRFINSDCCFFGDRAGEEGQVRIVSCDGYLHVDTDTSLNIGGFTGEFELVESTLSLSEAINVMLDGKKVRLVGRFSPESSYIEYKPGRGFFWANGAGEVYPAQSVLDQDGRYIVVKEVPDRKLTLEEASEPLIKYINDNWHPHVSVIVDCNSAQVVEGQITHCTDKYIKD